MGEMAENPHPDALKTTILGPNEVAGIAQVEPFEVHRLIADLDGERIGRAIVVVVVHHGEGGNY